MQKFVLDTGILLGYVRADRCGFCLKRTLLAIDHGFDHLSHIFLDVTTLIKNSRLPMSDMVLAVQQKLKDFSHEQENQRTTRTQSPAREVARAGAAALTDEELVAGIVGMGTAGGDVRTTAKQVAELIRKHREALTLDHLLSVPGMDLANGGQVLSSFELARRYLVKETTKIECAADVLPLVADIACKLQEHFVCLTLNGANELIERRIVMISLDLDLL